MPTEVVSMPPVARGRRRLLLAGLVGLGLVQAASALAMAVLVDGLLADAATPQPEPVMAEIATLVSLALAIGVARWAERVLAEQLGQDYVFEQRRRLIVSALLGDSGNKSLGVIVTRASNDLNSVRNWIAQGIVPLVTGVPLISVILVGLAVMNWRVALAVTVPIVVVAALLPALSALAFAKARKLRRHRGRMSAHIADTVRAGESVLVSGATRRELNTVDRNSAKVVAAAVDRARVTGLIRALTVTAASLGTAAVVSLAAVGATDAAGVAAVLTLVGVMATPLGDLGRVVEYRQNYRAAARILAPMLAEAEQLRRTERSRERAWRAAESDHPAGCGVRVRAWSDDTPIPPLDATPGDRVLLHSRRPDRIRAVLHELLTANDGSDRTGDSLVVLVNGVDLTKAPGKQRRQLVGFASHRVPLERGSVGRLISYRQPHAEAEEVDVLLQRVGLAERVAASRDGHDQKLKNDGAPWPGADVARLKLGRALLGDPPLLVLEDLDADLDEPGVDLLRGILADYPGVVLFSSSRPRQLTEHYRVWPVGDHVPSVRVSDDDEDDE